MTDRLNYDSTRLYRLYFHALVPKKIVNIFTTNPKWRTCFGLSNRSLFMFCILSCLCMTVQPVRSDHDNSGNVDYTHANFELSFTNETGHQKLFKNDYGHYGVKSKISGATGVLILVRTIKNKTDGCDSIDPAVIPAQDWIALIERGSCRFKAKISNAAKANATAVVIINMQNEKDNQKEVMEHDERDVIAVYIDDKERGQYLLDLLKTAEVRLIISPGTTKHSGETTPRTEFGANNTSVLFVSISFIVLIIISLAWLVFYYIQRCRYTNAKERLSRRLANAAKKAIAKTPQRTLKNGDKELDSEYDQCAVCIEPYKPGDVIRILPCKHVFHKSCVDPWLLDQRSCPMCKLDILRAYGMHLNGSQESVPQDQDSGMLTSSPAIEETEPLSNNSEEQGAVGGVKIVLYQHPAVRYQSCEDMEFSSEASVSAAECRTAECHVECTNQALLEQERLKNQPSLAPSVSLDSVHSVEEIDEMECNENQSLMTGLPCHGSVHSLGQRSANSLGQWKKSSSNASGIVDMMNLEEQ